MGRLKPCPFCGGEARIDINVALRGYRVACKSTLKCGAMFEWYDTEKEAIEAWNTRNPMEEMVAELEDAYYEFYSMEQHDKENPFNEGLLEGYKRTLEIVRGKE